MLKLKLHYFGHLMWRTGESGALQSMGLQRVKHNLVTKQQQNTFHRFVAKIKLNGELHTDTKWCLLYHKNSISHHCGCVIQKVPFPVTYLTLRYTTDTQEGTDAFASLMRSWEEEKNLGLSQKKGVEVLMLLPPSSVTLDIKVLLSWVSFLTDHFSFLTDH